VVEDEGDGKELGNGGMIQLEEYDMVNRRSFQEM